MSTARIAPTAGRVFVALLATGPHGFPLCRFCRRETSSARSTFCSPQCVHEHKLRTQPGYVRECVFARDKGICAVCRVDTEAILAELRSLARKRTRTAGLPAVPTTGKTRVRRKGKGKTRNPEPPPHVLALLVKLGYPVHRYRTGSLWDADHIRPVAEGGGECGLDNYQSLCFPCHHRKSVVYHRAKQQTAR